MAGDGVFRPKIERYIKENNLERKVFLLGWYRQIPRLLAALDIFVLTSYWEGLPICVMEAMAASLPVVATNTGGIAELIHEPDNGYLVSPRDIPALTNRIIELLSDREVRAHIGSNNRRCLVSALSPLSVAEKTQSVYSAC